MMDVVLSSRILFETNHAPQNADNLTLSRGYDNHN